MQLVSIYGRNNAKFCIKLFCCSGIFSFIYLMIQWGRGGHQNAHIGSHRGKGPEGVKFG